MEKVILRIQGMHCGSCANAIRAYLSTQEGVSEASVSYEEGRAEVSFDPGKIKEEEIKKAVEEIGYRVGV